VFGESWIVRGSIATFADGIKPSSEIHVATTGGNTTGDGTAGNP
jgi:hypothetical protein